MDWKIVTFFLIATFISLSEQKNCSYGFVFNSVDCIPCGITTVKPWYKKIVGGIKAEAHSWPSQVFIRQVVSGLLKFIDDRGQPQASRINAHIYRCGGTLINPQTVMTAAHCVRDKEGQYPIQFSESLEDSFHIYLGINYNGFITIANDPKKEESLVQLKVARAIKHPDYDLNGNMENDIALLHLTEPVALNNEIQPACLPESESTSYPAIDQTALIVGWGKKSETHEGNTKSLYNVEVNILSGDKCATTIKKYAKDFSKQICAGDIEGNRDACLGDSGGALYRRETIDDTLKNVAAGVVSYGEGCARVNQGSIYTRSSKYLEWIKANMKIPDFVKTSNKKE